MVDDVKNEHKELLEFVEFMHNLGLCLVNGHRGVDDFTGALVVDYCLVFQKDLTSITNFVVKYVFMCGKEM